MSQDDDNDGEGGFDGGREGGQGGRRSFGGNRSGGRSFSGGNRSGGRSGGFGGRSGGRSGGFGGGGGFRRNNFDGPREMHKAVCSECKKECEVPFKPTQGKPVFCKDCFQKHKKY